MAEQVHILRYVTDTLALADREQLPQVVPSLLDHLGGCSDLICGTINAGNTGATQTHKLRTQISSFLQDKTIQGRWAAVVLIKTVVETVIRQREGWEVLQTSVSWIRGLLAILGVSHLSFGIIFLNRPRNPIQHQLRRCQSLL